MPRLKFLLIPLLTLGACSPSPLYVDRAQVGTYGEVPRDGHGEPIWSQIRAAPLPSAGEPLPPRLAAIPS